MKSRGTRCERRFWKGSTLFLCTQSDLRIPFASHEHAIIAKESIDVDAELQPQAVKRTLKVEGDMLVA